MYVIVSYDITNNKIRTRIHDILKNYGTRVLYSVFECDIDRDDLATLRLSIEPLIEEGDSIRYYRLCAECLESVLVDGSRASPASGLVRPV